MLCFAEEVDGDESSISGLLVMALQALVGGYEGGAIRANGYRGDGVSGVQWIERVEGDTLEGTMEEDTELEEGEALEGRSSMDDLDLRFGYLVCGTVSLCPES